MTEVAHGEINIDVRDREALAALHRLEGEFDRSMSHIAREKAEAKAVLDTSQIDQEVKNTKRKLRELEARKAKLKVDGRAFKKVNEEITATEKHLKQLDGKQATMHLKVRGQDEILKAEKKLAAARAKEARLNEQRQAKAERIATQSQRRIAAAEKAAAAEATRNEKQRMDAIQRRSRVSSSLRRQEAQEMRAAERAAYTIDTARTRAELAAKREMAAVPRLREEYLRLARQVESYDSKRRAARRSRDPIAMTEVEVKNDNALRRIREIDEHLRRLGHPPPEIDIHVSPGRKVGEELRKTFKDRGPSLAAWHAGQMMGDRVSEGFKSRFNRKNFSKERALEVVGSGLSRGASKIGHMLSGLSQATVRLGPFTASIRGALIGLSAFGPIIVDLVGALGSLVSVVGAAGVGLGALGAGLIGGAIPAAIGFFTVLKPIAGEFKNAMAASKAYNDALRKGNTELAAKKLKELHATLGNVDAQTKKNFEGAGKLRDRWQELTKPARASAFKVIGEGLKFASDNADDFGKRTNKSFDVAQKSISRMISGLGSGEGKNILNTMFDNFNKGLGPALDGLANVGVYLGRVGRIGSSFLPTFTGQFKRWSQGLADGASNSGKLTDKITRMVDALRSVGRFTLASGRFLKAFFGGGVAAGERFTDTMTNALNRWTAFLGTTEGQQSLGNFFQRAVTGAQSLYSALAPIATAFVSWASSLSPVVAGLIRGVGAVGNFVSAVLRLTGLRGPVTAIATTLGALWAVGRIGSAAVAVGNFTRAILGLEAAQTGIAGLGAASGLAAAETGALGVAGAGAAGRMGGLGSKASSATRGVAAMEGAAAGGAVRVGALRAVATQAVPAIGEMGAIAGGAATLGLTALAAGAVYGVYKLISLKSSSEKARDSLKDLAAPAHASAKAFRTNAYSAVAAGSALHQNRLQLRALKDQLDHTKKGTDAHKSALLQYRDQVRYTTASEKAWANAKSNSTKTSKEQVKVEGERKKLAKQISDAEKNTLAQPAANAVGVSVTSKQEREHAKHLQELRDRYDELTAAADRASNRQAAAGANMARAYADLDPVLGRAEQQLGRLAKQNKPLAKKIALKYEAPKDVGKVSAAASRALKAGVPKKVTTNIAVNSANAEQAVKRLQKARIRSISFRIIATGGTTAIKFLDRIQGTKLGNKVFKILGQDTSARNKIRQLIALGIPPKTAKMLGNNTDAIRKAREANAQHLRTLEQIIQRAINNPANLFTNPPSLTQQVRRVVSGVGLGGRPNAAGGTFASGGVVSGTGATPDQRRIERAQREAARGSVRDIRAGGKVTRPTILAGEENKTEFVIATNPRYRKRSIALLNAAARTLLGGDKVAKAGSDDGLEAAAAGRGPVAQSSGKHRKSKGNKPLKLKGTPTKTMRRLNFWRDEEDRWNREGGLLEMRLDEPKSFIKESGRKLPDGSPQMIVDDNAVNSYWGALDAIKTTYNKALNAMQNIQKLLPAAKREVDQTRKNAANNIKKLNKAIAKDEKLAKSKHKKVSGPAKSRLKTNKKKLRTQQGKLNDSNDDLSTLRDETKEVDWRRKEQIAKIAEWQEDMDAVRPEAAASAADANKQSDTAGGGSSDLSYGQQVAAGAAEKAGVLRDFATNLNAPLGSGATASATASTDAPQKRMLATASTMGAAIGSTLAASGSVLTATPSDSVSGAAIATLGGGSTAAAMAEPSSSLVGANAAGSIASGDGGVAASGGDTTFNQYNTFTEPPTDPHTWSKGVEYEMGAIL